MFCPPCSYLVVTNPLLSFPDPRLSGKKRRSKEEGASTKDLREWEENVEAMRLFTKSLYAERGTAHWTESVEFDLHERRMWDECVPPREFGPVPTFNLQADGAYQKAWRSMTVCKDDERITEIPAVCKKLDGDAKKCGATPQTIGRCRWRESKCRAFSLFPHWGKIEFTDCKAGSVGETVCGEVMYQWCRRVYPGTQALATAKGPLKLDDLHFSRWLVLTRVVSAQQQKVLARHHYMLDAPSLPDEVDEAEEKEAEEKQTSEESESGTSGSSAALKSNAIFQQKTEDSNKGVLTRYHQTLRKIRRTMCPGFEVFQKKHFGSVPPAAMQTLECNLRIATCRLASHIRAFQGLLSASELRPEVWKPEFIEANGKGRVLEGIQARCDHGVQQKIAEADSLAPKGFFRESLLWSQELVTFQHVMDPSAVVSPPPPPDTSKGSDTWHQKVRESKLENKMLKLGRISLMRSQGEEQREEGILACEVCLRANVDGDARSTQEATRHWCMREKICQDENEMTGGTCPETKARDAPARVWKVEHCREISETVIDAADVGEDVPLEELRGKRNAGEVDSVDGLKAENTALKKQVAVLEQENKVLKALSKGENKRDVIF